MESQKQRVLIGVGVLAVVAGFLAFRFWGGSPKYGPQSVGIERSAQETSAPQVTRTGTAGKRDATNAGEGGRRLTADDAEQGEVAADEAGEKKGARRKRGRQRKRPGKNATQDEPELEPEQKQRIPKRAAPFRRK